MRLFLWTIVVVYGAELASRVIFWSAGRVREADTPVVQAINAALTFGVFVWALWLLAGGK